MADLEIDLLRQRATRAGQRLDLTTKEFPLLSLLARRAGAELDRTLIQRAVGNLVYNAVAHTPEGGTVAIKTHSESGQRVFIEVIDTGVGIPPDALPRVFERCFRVDPSRSKASGGTGLGLSIVQGIVCSCIAET